MDQKVINTLPPNLIEKTRDWAFEEFNFGEWFPATVIQDYLRTEFGYGGTTPQQYAARFIARGVANRDFETRLKGREWRWIAHPQNAAKPSS